MNIFKAARTGNVKVLESYILHGADLSQRKGERKNTVLHEAAKLNQTEIVRVLLESGADIEAKNFENSTPIFSAVAIENGESDCLRLLIDAGANVNAEHDKYSVLHLAANNDNFDAVQMLIEAGALVNAQNQYGATPLHSAAEMNNAQSVKALLKGGADPTILNHQSNCLKM
jgi:ankyrin repeat protein